MHTHIHTPTHMCIFTHVRRRIYSWGHERKSWPANCAAHEHWQCPESPNAVRHTTQILRRRKRQVRWSFWRHAAKNQTTSIDPRSSRQPRYADPRGTNRLQEGLKRAWSENCIPHNANTQWHVPTARHAMVPKLPPTKHGKVCAYLKMSSSPSNVPRINSFSPSESTSASNTAFAKTVPLTGNTKRCTNEHCATDTGRLTVAIGGHCHGGTQTACRDSGDTQDWNTTAFAVHAASCRPKHRLSLPRTH